MKLAGIVVLVATALALAGCCCMVDEEDDDEEFYYDDDVPSIHDIRAVSGTDYIAIGWETYPETKAWIEYGITQDLGNIGYADSLLAGRYRFDHFVIIHDLKPQTIYYFKIKARSGVDVEGESQLLAFRTR